MRNTENTESRCNKKKALNKQPNTLRSKNFFPRASLSSGLDLLSLSAFDASFCDTQRMSPQNLAIGHLLCLLPISMNIHFFRNQLGSIWSHPRKPSITLSNQKSATFDQSYIPLLLTFIVGLHLWKNAIKNCLKKIHVGYDMCIALHNPHSERKLLKEGTLSLLLSSTKHEDRTRWIC